MIKMINNKKAYHQILKTTSLFGGLQFFTILISIIRTKLIAVFIGPIGMGIISLLNSTLNLIGGISGLGIDISAVKTISENYKSDDLKTVSHIVRIVKRIVFFTGLLGFVLTIIFSKTLSIITFGDSSQTYSFLLIAITLLFKQLSTGQLVVLQALQQMKFLAKANLYGNFFGLLFSVPLYFFLRVDAIVPTIIISSISALFFSFYYSNKIKFQNEKVKKSDFLVHGKIIIKLGVMLIITSLLTLLSSCLIQIYICNVSDITQVGFYNAGFTLLNSYVGMIFTAMSTDYFPRLAAINNDNEKIRINVGQQSFVSVLVITPIIVLFLIFTPLIIRIIFTPKFNIIMPMICVGILGMLFKAVSWSLGYILIAKGDSKIFITTAIGFNSVFVLLSVFGYNLFGLEGLGMSFFLYYILHFLVLKLITKKRYGFYFDKEFYSVFLICFLMCILTFFLRYIEFLILKYSLMIGMCFLSIFFVLYHMNKKINLIKMLLSVLKNNKNL